MVLQVLASLCPWKPQYLIFPLRRLASLVLIILFSLDQGAPYTHEHLFLVLWPCRHLEASLHLSNTAHFTKRVSQQNRPGWWDGDQRTHPPAFESGDGSSELLSQQFLAPTYKYLSAFT